MPLNVISSSSSSSSNSSNFSAKFTCKIHLIANLLVQFLFAAALAGDFVAFSNGARTIKSSLRGKWPYSAACSTTVDKEMCSIEKKTSVLYERNKLLCDAFL